MSYKIYRDEKAKKQFKSIKKNITEIVFDEDFAEFRIFTNDSKIYVSDSDTFENCFYFSRII